MASQAYSQIYASIGKRRIFNQQDSGSQRGVSCLDRHLFFAASPVVVVVVVISDAAAARPAVRHGWLRLLLPHGRRLP
jgi:hypothetical protein